MRARTGTIAAGLVLMALTGCGNVVPLSDAATDTAPSTAPTSPAPTNSAPTSPAPTNSAPTNSAPNPPVPSTATPSSGGSASPSRTPNASPAPTTPAAMLAAGDRGEKVRELQHRLRQLDWYSGSITGRYATETTDGVKGFQDKRKVTVTGTVDQTTWTKLVAMTTTPTTAELHNKLVAGPAIMSSGDDSSRVRQLQARLRQIGWFSGNVTDHYGAATVSSVKGFQSKRGVPVTGAVDQRTWDRLTAMTRTPTSNELANQQAAPTPVGNLDPRCLTGRALCISKSADTLVWVVDGKQQFRASVRFGSELTPTREGAFSVGWKSRNHVSTIYHTPMPYAMFFSGGQAVHYSADFAARGYNGASHGCVNVRDYHGIASLFDQVRVGDKVIVYR